MSAGTVPLKRLFSSVRGGAWGTEPGTDEVTLPCVRGTDFDYAHLRVDLSSAPLRGFSRADVAVRAATRGDLIIEKSGGGETQPVGRVALHDHDELVMPTNFAGRLRPARDVDSRFACYVFASLYSGGRTRAAIKQTTGIQNLDLDALLATRVRCPELPEQRAVADYLDRETARIDALIEKKHSAAELLLERWLAALCSRLLGRKRHEPFSRVEQSAAGELTLIPLKRLLEHVWSGDWGGEPGSNDIDLTCIRAADFDFALLEASGGVDRSFAATSVRGRALLPGDLVIEKSGGGDGVPVGRVVVWRGPGLAMPTNFAGAMRPDPRFDPDFVLLVFRAAYEIGLPWRSIKQTTGLQNLDMTHYLSQHWPVPDVPEQRRVASELMEELRSCRKAQELFHRQIDLLREHRQALITAAVTGGLEVPGVAA